MAQQHRPTALAAVNYQRIYLTLVLSIVWLVSDACAAPMVNALAGIPQYGTRQQADKQLTLLNELFNNVNEEALLNELKKYRREQPNYLSKWPGLRDLVLMPDYADIALNSDDGDDNYELPSFEERLKQISTNALDGAEVAHDSSAGRKDNNTYKTQGVKKNLQSDMSPCHFKICNMGRKRNARYFED
ncbi:uncharacterized protein LOC126761485 isoform X1 [Bactrocera neohumeralis]|uniref:uncharacterized protein LOC126761485 isoform X1 n=1 Tax=Bactrocera neohumeralis TaxID=98809 RepID=UPI002165C73D|nr:uncharacterized protein LOC126761485 isoform X1 [Bactrocera neohumeralis]XP_050333633.1 uncharacterized protein LOC126761485 isoform X1 [Bactrocera neohumeralis]